MEFFRKETKIDFLGLRVPALALSVLLIFGSIGALATKGLNFGIDFTGGVLLEVGYPEAVELEPIRNVLNEQGYGDAVVQHFGVSSDVLIRLQPRDEKSSADISTDVLRALRQSNESAEMRRVEFVGPQIGDELTNQGIEAMMFALIGILIYVSLRFQWKLALGSVAALAHDVTLIMGFFALFQVPFDLTVLAAVLAVIGYSLNDTIVVFDRIRENFRLMRKGTTVDIANVSINQNLSRTLMTSGTTLLVLLALFYLGGEVIHSFAEALIIGVVVGTYSSIYIASALALMLGVSKEDLLPIEDKEPVDDLP
ncbi:MAG: protein translocase subunit SecF [Gammaproteobacteria bacterium]|nr:protein translocase subunit SecF [Gammaproteobacteria bacterium]